jgi:hypothetical protein
VWTTPRQQDDNSSSSAAASCCFAFLVLAIHTAAFVAVFANTTVFATTARARHARQTEQRRAGGGRNRYRRLARSKQDVQISSQAATTATVEAAEAVVGIDVGIRIRVHVVEKGTEIEWNKVAGTSICRKAAAK